MIRLLIIADDFTGALDTGVQFAACGAVTRVITDWNADLSAFADTCEILVVDAETRHLESSRAKEIVSGVVAKAIKLGVSHIFKKTDSALRGNIGAELTALLEASGRDQLPFLPAFPQMNRRTVDGIHYIGDVPVAESVFGKDPFDPVTKSYVPDVIALQSDAKVISCPKLTENSACSDASGIVVYDASTLEDLSLAAQKLLAEDRLHIMAGCAGLGSVLPKLLKLGTGALGPMPQLDPNFLVICGSVNPITVAQSDRAEAAGFLRVRLEPGKKLNPGYWDTSDGEAEFQRLSGLLSAHARRILDTNDLDGNKSTADYAAAHNMSIEDVRQAVSRTVGYLVSRLFPDPDLGTLLVTGGDTLLQCMDYMNIREIEPLRELDSGVVLSRFSYRGVTRYVISKSGGFGKEDLFVRLAEMIAK